MELNLTEQEAQFLKLAKAFLERPGWSIRLAEKVGRPVEWTIEQLPAVVKDRLEGAAQTAIEHAFTMALKTIKLPEQQSQLDLTSLQQQFELHHLYAKQDLITHGLVMGGAGALGGFLGTAGTLIEIPISTTLIMRDMLQVGITFGVNAPDVLIPEALSLFTYGSLQNTQDDAANSAYFSARLAYQQLIRDSGAFLAQHSAKAILETLKHSPAPVLVRLMANIAARFNVTLTEKLVTQAMPVLGALGGATINTVFAHYYHQLSYYHFGIKNLEMRYGKENVQQLYMDVRH